MNFNAVLIVKNFQNVLPKSRVEALEVSEFQFVRWNVGLLSIGNALPGDIVGPTESNSLFDKVVS
jgi:hypothetical protein